MTENLREAALVRGALDTGATTINEAMKLAAVRAIAELTHPEEAAFVTGANIAINGGQHMQ